MPKTKIDMYTLVQHSGYGYGKDGMFARGLESRHVGSASERDRVAKAGGLLFENAEGESAYMRAEDYAEHEMYRTVEGDGLVPQAPGTFASAVVDGLRIYVPFEPDATYAAFHKGQQFGIVSGRSAADIVSRSTDPANLRFERL